MPLLQTTNWAATDNEVEVFGGIAFNPVAVGHDVSVPVVTSE